VYRSNFLLENEAKKTQKSTVCNTSPQEIGVNRINATIKSTRTSKILVKNELNIFYVTYMCQLSSI
jgi:hypothetical protein